MVSRRLVSASVTKFSALMESPRAVWLIGALALILVLVAYWPGMKAGFYFDDLPNITQVRSIHWTEFSLAGVEQVLSDATLGNRPLANLSFALNHLFSGLDPVGYHWTNLVIHLLAGLALVWVAVLMARERAPEGINSTHILLSAIAATAVFWLHPLNIQGVTYVVQRMTSMSALFVMLSFGCYLTGRSRSGWRMLWWFSLSLLSWLLGLLSKEIAVVLPLLVLLYEAFFHAAFWRERYAALVGRVGHGPLLLMLWLPVLLLAIGIGYTYYHPGLLSWNELLNGRDFTGAQRVMTEARVHFFYLGLLVWPDPSGFNLDHHFPLSRSLFEPWNTLPALIGWLLLVVGSLWLAWRNPRYGFPLLGYWVFHLIESGPINLELVFEHRMYLPMMFLAVLGTNLLVDFAQRRVSIFLFILLLLVPLSWATYERNLVWADPIGFLRDCATKSPNKFRPWFNLGTELGKAGQLGESEQALLNALKVKPEHSQTHNQLGNVYLLTGRRQQAFGHYKEAFAADPSNLEVMYNLGMQYAARGQRQEAVKLLRRFIQNAPVYLGEARNRAILRLRQL